MARTTRLLLVFLFLFLFAAVPAATAADAACPTPQRFAVGQQVFTRPGVFVRNLPTLSGGQVGYYPNSVTLRITDGPVCADGLNWWQVTTPGNPGWVAEAVPDLVLLFPDTSFNNGQNCAPALGLTIGGQATLLEKSVRLRADPDRSGRVLTVLNQFQPVYVLAGPTCADNINWWQVRAQYGSSTSTVDGWLAEAAGGTTFLSAGGSGAPTEPAHCPPTYYRLSVGIRAVVTYQDSKPKNLRAEPGMNAAVLTSMLKGVEVDIIGGPTCVDGLNWWQLRLVGQPELVGWLAEGGVASNQWLRPLIYN
jgi:hypothetical protein